MTTTNSLLLAATASGVAGIFGTTSYHQATGQITASVTTEAQVASPANTALTLANFGIRLTANNQAPTFNARVNAGNGSGVISVSSSATGWFTDSTHTDSVTAGQTFDCSQPGGTGTTITIVNFALQKTSPLVAWHINGQVNFSTTTDYEWPHGGEMGSQNNEAVVKTLARAAGTWKNLATRVQTSVTGTITIKSRVGGADGSQALSSVNPTAGTVVQDTTHTDTIASGNLTDISHVCSASSGSWNILYSEFAGTISAHDLACTNTNTGGGTGFTASTTYFLPFSGALSMNTTEANVQAVLPYALTLTRLRTRVRSNSSATATIQSRKGGSNGNNVISVSSGTTGELEDSTHSDSYSATNTANTTVVVGSAVAFTLDNVVVLLDDGSVTANVNYTLTAAQGTYTLTGKAAGLAPNYRVTAAQGSYSLTGEAVGFPRGIKLTAVQGTYTLSGKAAGLGRGLTLTAAEGTYALTGENTLGPVARKVVAAQGTYTLTGKDVHRKYFLTSDFGTYHIIGEDVASGHARTLKAHHGKYRVKKQKTILRLNSGESVIWPVDTGDYILTGEDVIFGQEILRFTFSEFSNSDFLDWEQSDYTSYLDAAYVLPDGLNFTFVPYVYVFIEDGVSSDDVGLLMTVAKDWAETGNLPKLGGSIQVYRFRDGYLLAVSKNRIRGKGRAFQLQFTSETGKDFNLRGWGMWLEKNTRP